MKLLVESPINNLSLGNVGYNILKECFKRNYEVGFFPMGQTDLSAFKTDPKFHAWLQKSINRRWDLLKKDVPCIKNWHLSSSDTVRTNKQILLTYHEVSKATKVEIAIANLQHKTLFCGGYSEGVFKNFGAKNVGSFNLGFDEEFFETDKKYLSNYSWNLGAKWEYRKLTGKILSLWAKKYGNNREHSLNLLVNNPFFSPEDNQKLIAQALEGKRYFNINVLPRLQTNLEVNEWHNAATIDLTGICPSESWNICPFTSTALGKWAVATASAGNLAWATEENSIMIQPSGMRPSHDGVFFKDGGDFNQGEFFDVSDETILEGFERAEKKFGQKNVEGQKLKTEFTYSKTLDQILSHL